MLGMMQVSKKIPFEDENVLLGVRVLYIVSNLIIAGIYLYIRSRVNAKKGTPQSQAVGAGCAKHSTTTASKLIPTTDMTVLEYVEPAPMGSGEEPKVVTTNVHSYDLEQVRAAFKGQLTGMAMMAFMHLYLKFTNPLLMQSIIPLKTALEGNLAKVWLFNKPAVGELKRPWKAAAGFMGMGAGEVKTDKKSIDDAKKANRGGAKDE